MATGGQQVVVWEWRHEHGSWQPYTSVVSNYLEQRHRNLQPGIAGTFHHGMVNLGEVESTMAMYCVDLTNLKQTRAGTGKCR